MVKLSAICNLVNLDAVSLELQPPKLYCALLNCKRGNKKFNPVDPKNRYTGLSVFAHIPRNRYTGLTVYVCMYAKLCMYVCIYVCIYACLYIYVWMNVCMYVYTCTYICMYMYI